MFFRKELISFLQTWLALLIFFVLFIIAIPSVPLEGYYFADFISSSAATDAIYLSRSC